MTGKILVALKKNDRAEDVFPYIQQLVRPGMKVAFLFPDPADGFDYLLRHKGTLETGLHGAFAAKAKVERSVADSQRDSVRQKIFLASEELRKQGVDIAVEFYSGSLARALKRCFSGEAHLTIISARRRALAEILWLLRGSIKRQAPSSVVLLQPAAVGRSK